MSKELLIELGHKKMYNSWKHQQVAQEEYRVAVTSCRDEDRKVKVNLKGAWDAKGKKNVVHKYINSKRKTRENMGLLLNGAEELVIKNTK